MPTADKQHERAMFGCIVTLRRRDTDELSSHHVQGMIRVALPAFLDKYDPRVYGVVSISSPASVLADLTRDTRGGAEAALLARLNRKAHLWAA
jgi:hypothetical protein